MAGRIYIGWAAGAAVTALMWTGGAHAQTSEPSPPAGVADAISGGRLLLEIRGRYEEVDQTRTAALRERGQAATLRTRLGWETARWQDLRGLIEFEDVRQIGPVHYQVQVPGATAPPLNGAAKARYPVVNDPAVTELNRLQLTWTPNAAWQVTGGRQRIALEDQRFVGNVGWRQDEQTFDAVRADVSLGRWKATYAYVAQANRILGEARDWDSDSHLFNVSYAADDRLRLLGFVYTLDFANSPVNSSITAGGKVSAKAKAGLYQLAYNATYARQSDYRANTRAFDLDFYAVDLAATRGIWTVRAAYEALEGDGTLGFTTPLATTHAFNGWSDAWVSAGGNKSFADGIKDLNVTVMAKPGWRWAYLGAVQLTARYHDFDDQRTGADLAHEFDAQAAAAITPRITALLKVADFRRQKTVPAGTLAPPASRTKVWFSLEYRL